MAKRSSGLTRCGWAADEPLLREYHDREWGVPEHDDRRLFEFLVLDGAQAGLSWVTILRKRENYRRAFHGFNPDKVARYGSRDIRRLLGDSGIVRNRLKIASTIGNAKAFLEVQEAFGSFNEYVWMFVEGTPRKNRWRAMSQIPARTGQSDAMSRDLRGRGFSFVGSTICYAFMQAAGLVNSVTARWHVPAGAGLDEIPSLHPGMAAWTRRGVNPRRLRSLRE
ncbi:MAG: DNA-3-methyladenine glycosylase I [Methanobacteriota archaeon]|nr:MAG: DNA-3-methyladenine glycosylase I [Euryarchaeota archaeon]